MAGSQGLQENESTISIVVAGVKTLRLGCQREKSQFWLGTEGSRNKNEKEPVKRGHHFMEP